MDTEFLTWDDKVAIVENPVVNQGFSLTKAQEALSETVLNLWSPVSQWSHQLDVSLFGMNADAHHLMSLIYHLLAGIALWWALSALPKLNQGYLVRVLTVGLFLLHPVQVESWAWIAERKDLLVAIFCFLSIGAWQRWIVTGSKAKLILFFISLFLGLMSKPLMVVISPVLLALWWCQKEESKVSLKQMMVPLGVTVAASLVVAMITLQINSGREEMLVMSKFSAVQRMQLGFSNYFRYLLRVFYPVELSYFYPYPALAPRVLMGLGIVLVMASVGSIFYWLKRMNRLALCPLIFLLFLLPTVGFIISGESCAPDRYGYIANVGVFLLIGVLLQKWKVRNPIKACMVALLLLGSLPLTLMQAKTWQNMDTLTAHAIVQNSDNYKALFHRAAVYQKRGEVELSRKLIERVYEIRPDHQQAALILAEQALKKEEYDKAESLFQMHQNHWRGHLSSMEGLAVVKVRLGKLEEAIALFSELVKREPKVDRYSSNLKQLKQVVKAGR